MKIKISIIEPSFEVLTSTDGLIEHLELCGRTCYKSEDKITNDSAGAFVRRIIKSGHESVIEHASMTVRFIGSRDFSHQLVRHRLDSFSMESQRYCNYGKKCFQFIAPPELEIPVGEYHLFGSLDHHGSDTFLYTNETRATRSPVKHVQTRWLHQRFRDCEEYLALLDTGIRPEDARSVLPNAMKTEVVMTANCRQWRHVFRERALNKHAQWQIRGLMLGVLKEFVTLMPDIFGDLE